MEWVSDMLDIAAAEYDHEKSLSTGRKSPLMKSGGGGVTQTKILYDSNNPNFGG
jgi:hypothetical protein